MTLYDDAMNAKPRFKNNKEALDHYVREYEALGAKYGKTGEELWIEAESSPVYKEHYNDVFRLYRSIMMCRYLIKKENKSD